MALPSSGPMTASMINVELGRASTAPFSINGAPERALAGKPSGAISFSDFYGKSNGPAGSTKLICGTDGRNYGYYNTYGLYFGTAIPTTLNGWELGFLSWGSNLITMGPMDKLQKAGTTLKIYDESSNLIASIGGIWGLFDSWAWHSAAGIPNYFPDGSTRYVEFT